MPKIIVEICCGSADDVIQAKLGGAERVELNSSMFMGGLTATVGTLTIAKRTGLSIMAMVRPREGGFCYTDAEFETMLLDTAELIKAGADGIVFGILNQDGTVDTSRCKEMLSVIGDKQSVFHRALDVVPDWRAALDELINLKITRVLTSGQEQSALLGAETIRQMVEYAADRIEICVGGGVRLNTVNDIIEKTGADQVHAYLTRSMSDNSTTGNPAIHFGGALYPPEDMYKMADARSVEELISKVKHAW